MNSFTLSFGGHKRVALMGGSFDPAHKGHILVAQNAIQSLHLDYVVWLVAAQNPLKQNRPAPMEKRLLQAKSLITGITDPKIKVMSDPHIYAIDTCRAWIAHYPQCHFVWLMGTDNWCQFHRWRGWQDMMHQIPIALYPRPHTILPSMNSVAAQRFANYRVPLAEMAQLPINASPAWTLLAGKTSALASQDLR